MLFEKLYIIKIVIKVTSLGVTIFEKTISNTRLVKWK